jgi:hypothetical protein
VTPKTPSTPKTPTRRFRPGADWDGEGEMPHWEGKGTTSARRSAHPGMNPPLVEEYDSSGEIHAYRMRPSMFSVTEIGSEFLTPNYKVIAPEVEFFFSFFVFLFSF